MVNFGGTRIACGITTRIGLPKQANPMEGDIIFDVLQSSIYSADSDRNTFYDLSDVEITLRTVALRSKHFFCLILITIVRYYLE